MFEAFSNNRSRQPSYLILVCTLLLISCRYGSADNVNYSINNNNQVPVALSESARPSANKTNSLSSQYEHFFYLDFASHYFQPGQFDPIPTKKQKPTDDKQLDSVYLDLESQQTRVIEGDILVDGAPSPPRKDGVLSRHKRKIINEFDRRTRLPTRWPNNIVPYEIDNTMSLEMIERIQKAMNHWHSYTCVRFEQYDSTRHRNYRCKLVFQSGNLCGSYVGYFIEPSQYVYNSNVYLGTQCAVGNIIHELGHAIGFRHEQSRVDRDENVRVNFDRIDPGLRDQYTKMDDPQPGYYGVKYDLFSVMHYAGQNGILEAVDPNRNFLMGQRVGLSFLDMELANKAYKCSAPCPGITCQNGGFLTRDCKCFCPDSLTGAFCETVIANGEHNNRMMEMKASEPNLNCNFESGTLCEWKNDKLRSMQDWIINRLGDKGNTELQVFFKSYSRNSKTGPQNGDRYGNSNGRYLYASSYSKGSPNANLILISPKLKTTFPRTACIRFWYHMFQSSFVDPNYPIKIGNLSVNLRYANGNEKEVWVKSGSQGAEWLEAVVELPLKPPATVIYFEAFLKDWNYGDIAIDDIQFQMNGCNRPPQRDGSVSITDWGKWGECSSKCGRGIKKRHRKCVAENEADCQIALTQTQICQMPACRVPTFSGWGPYSKCVSIFEHCQPAYKYRTRTCLNSDVGECIGENVEYELCDYSEECLKSKNLNVPPSVSRDFEGESTIYNPNDILKALNEPSTESAETKFYRWGNWTECSAECGLGQQIRRMICTTMEKNDQCNPHVVEVRNCLVKLCGDLDGGKWSSWGEWSACEGDGENNLCDLTGTQYRERRCESATCVGNVTETRACPIRQPLDVSEYCRNQAADLLELDSYDCELVSSAALQKTSSNSSSPEKSCVIESIDDENEAGSQLHFVSISDYSNLGSFVLEQDAMALMADDYVELKLKAKMDAPKEKGEEALCFQMYYETDEEFNSIIDIDLRILDRTKNEHVRLNDTEWDYDEDENVFAFITNIPISSSNILTDGKIDLKLHIHFIESNADIEKIDFIIKSLFIKKRSCRSPTAVAPPVAEQPMPDKTANIAQRAKRFARDFMDTFGLFGFAETQQIVSQEGFGSFNLRLKDASSQTCGGEFVFNFKQKVIIASPNYPNQYTQNLRCNYLIKSPPNTKIRVRLIDLDLEKTRMSTCLDGLELRYFHLGQPGPIYCGQLTQPYTFTTYENFIMVIFRSDWGQANSHRGFHLEAEVAN